MPRQQTFDGPRLPEVLARVSAEAGPGAKIIDARKIRTGGFGGFFARERFEVRVQLPDANEAPGAPAQDLAAAPPASLLDLADLVDEAEADVSRHAIGRIPVAQVTATVARRAFEERMTDVATGSRAATGHVPAGRHHLPEEVLEPLEVSRAPLPSTESDEFRSVLQKLVADVEPPAPAPATPSAPKAQAGPVLFQRMPADELFVAPLPGTDLEAVDVQDDDEDDDEIVAGQDLPVPARALSLVHDWDDLLDQPPTQDELIAAIMRALEVPALPAETGPRATIAVVGSGWPALQVASSIARHVAGAEAAIDDAWEHDRPLHVLFPVGDDAYDTSWTGPTVVAIDAPMGNVDLAWASQVLDVLDPDLVWGVVDATRKNDDIQEWCVDLGGVDVLAVDNLDATCSPAAILELGLPVGLIDGRPATRLAWASLLAERVELSA